jgi:hypothetical protein
MGRITWAGFGGKERLWVLAGGQLTLRELATDKAAVTVAGTVAAPPALTPGGKQLAVCAGNELLLLRAGDGARLGVVPLPDGWGAVSLAAQPSGHAVAVTLANVKSDVLVGVWDLATGKRTDALVQTYHLTQRKLTGPLQWAGERRVICGSSVVDLDRHVILCDRFDPQGAAPTTGQTPDGRLWLIRALSDAEWAQIEKKLPAQAGPTTRTLLTAASLPETVTGPLDAAAKGVLWHPGVSVRVTAGDPVPKKYRTRLVEGTAELLAKEGYRIDPNAALTVEVVISPGGKKTGAGRQVPREQLTEDQKRQLQSNPMMAWYETTDVYDYGVQARVLDAGGRLALQSPRFLTTSTVKPGVGDDAAWEKLTEHGVGLQLPRLYLRDDGHKRLQLPKSFQPGVDGLLEPKVDAAAGPVKDGFELPEDGV